MKRVHKALHLRHHKHTGKLLPHKHTSYRVLFLLMLTPIIMMALVGQLATAVDYQVTAMVPAPMPSGAPVITSPTDSSTTKAEQITVKGTCPVIDPAIIVTVYDNGTLVGSAMCSESGTYTVPITLSLGAHTIVATVLTKTGQTGASSAGVRVTRIPSDAFTSKGETLSTLRLFTTDAYMEIAPNGQVDWHGHVEGGIPPYKVTVEWGDGSVDSYTVANQTDQVFSHIYSIKQTYDVIVTAKDTAGNSVSLHTTAGTLSTLVASTDMSQENTGSDIMPFVGFLRQHLWQIYIIVLSALVFLWYLERGRHVPGAIIYLIRKRFIRLRRHHR